MFSERKIGFLISFLVLTFCESSNSYTYEGKSAHPSSAFLQACSEENIAELQSRGAAASCAPGQNFGKFPQIHLFSDGCSMTACIECFSYDIYVGGKTCFKPPYHAVVTFENPEPKFCEGNPIDVVNGKKIQKEIDISPIREGQAQFYRVYTNSHHGSEGKWYHPYQRSLRPITPKSTSLIRAKSSGYSTRTEACEKGFNEIKNQINESWTQNARAILVDGCSIVVKQGNLEYVARKLHIVADAQEYSDKAFSHGVQLVRENGIILEFYMKLNASGFHTYDSFAGELGQLTHVNHNDRVAWRFVNNSGEIEEYSKSGKLVSITAKNGLKQELFYDQFSGQLTRVKDTTSREITFEYIGNLIRNVAIGGLTTSYSYNSDGLIQQVTRPDNTTRMYHYEDSRFPTFLTGITDERSVRYATWAYNSSGLGILSEHAGGADRTEFSFNSDGSTTVTNSLSAKTNYKIQKDIGGVKQVISSTLLPTQLIETAITNYSHASGYLYCTTDPKGIASCESKDRGVVTDRTRYLDSSFKTHYRKNYLWDPNNKSLIRFIEGEYGTAGRITDFTYDDKGNLKQKTTRAVNQLAW